MRDTLLRRAPNWTEAARFNYTMKRAPGDLLTEAMNPGFSFATVWDLWRRRYYARKMSQLCDRSLNFKANNAQSSAGQFKTGLRLLFHLLNGNLRFMITSLVGPEQPQPQGE